MRNSITTISIALMLLISYSCKAEETVKLLYIKSQYKETKNKSFISREMLFLKGSDTLQINIKIPFDATDPKIFNPGIYHNCHLKEDSIYTLSLKKICVNDIPDAYNSYYKINAVFSDKEDCSKFEEVHKDTKYLYNGYYGQYVDINNILYKIVGLSPDYDCFYPH